MTDDIYTIRASCLPVSMPISVCLLSCQLITHHTRAPLHECFASKHQDTQCSSQSCLSSIAWQSPLAVSCPATQSTSGPQERVQPGPACLQGPIWPWSAVQALWYQLPELLTVVASPPVHLPLQQPAPAKLVCVAAVPSSPEPASHMRQNWHRKQWCARWHQLCADCLPGDPKLTLGRCLQCRRVHVMIVYTVHEVVLITWPA